MSKMQPHLLVSWLIFFALVGGYLLMATQFPLAYIVATYEDLVGEWTQVFLFATTMLLSARLAFRKINGRWFFALLTLACFYVVGEEISWGQRIFDIPTPDFFLTHNQQNETNLHNFFTGPIKSTSKNLLEYLLAAGLTGYGLVYPFLIRLRLPFALWFNEKGLAFPPLYLWPFFVLSGFLELGYLKFNEAELAEILIPLALAIMSLNYLQAVRGGFSLTEPAHWQAPQSGRLAKHTALTLITVILLALGTTAACYSSPRLGPEIAKRYLNGVEKFAGRYQLHENWKLAARLYALVEEKKPQRTDILRELYRCHLQLGNTEKAQHFLEKAEQTDLDYLAKHTLSVATHLSLVETYELLKATDIAADHLEGSLLIAARNKKRNPQNDSAAYWLGRALEKSGSLTAAKQEYQRALELRPGSLKYRKALLSLRRRLESGNEAGDLKNRSSS